MRNYIEHLFLLRISRLETPPHKGKSDTQTTCQDDDHSDNGVACPLLYEASVCTMRRQPFVGWLYFWSINWKLKIILEINTISTSGSNYSKSYFSEEIFKCWKNGPVCMVLDIFGINLSNSNTYPDFSYGILEFQSLFNSLSMYVPDFIALARF